MYVLYATSDNGNGHVQKLGEYEDISDIQIHPVLFDSDVLLTIKEEKPRRTNGDDLWPIKNPDYPSFKVAGKRLTQAFSKEKQQ